MRRLLLTLLLLLLLTEPLEFLKQLFRSLDLLLWLLLLSWRRWGCSHLLGGHVLYRSPFSSLVYRIRFVLFLLFVVFRWAIGLVICCVDASSRSSAVRAQNDRPHIGRIFQAANQDEVVTRSIEKRVEHIPLRARAKLAEYSL